MAITNTAMKSKYLVGAPPATPPLYSLLAVANPAPDTDARWQMGVEWRPEQKGQGGVVAMNCRGGTDTLDGDFDLDGIAYADPFVVYAEDHCSTFGWQQADYEGRATRQLTAVQSARAAAELERGDLAQGVVPLDNHWLTENPDVVGSPATQTVIAALGDIEMGLAEHFGGRRGMVHASPALLIAMRGANLLDMQGNKWLTPMGHVVVSDAGYTGVRPDGNNSSTKQWLYGTAPVEYLLTPIAINPGTLDQARAEATTVGTNLTRVYAQRLVLLKWDTPVVAAETDVPAYS